MKYLFLENKIEEKGIKLTKIAEQLKITPRTLRNKISGKSDFNWLEVCTIQQVFFPEYSKEELFSSL